MKKVHMQDSKHEEPCIGPGMGATMIEHQILGRHRHKVREANIHGVVPQNGLLGQVGNGGTADMSAAAFVSVLLFSFLKASTFSVRSARKTCLLKASHYMFCSEVVLTMEVARAVCDCVSADLPRVY